MSDDKKYLGWNKISSKEDLPDPEKYDWVLVAIQILPEGYYGVPYVAECRNGIWYDHMDRDIEKDLGVKVTHWTTIPGDE